MAWVTGVTQVKHVDVPVQNGRRGPLIFHRECVVVQLEPHAVAEVVGCRLLVFLPEHTGAGPCGTYARYQIPDPLVSRNVRWRRSPFAWSIRYLIEPLRAYYAAYVPPKRFGAKPGPRGWRTHGEARV